MTTDGPTGIEAGVPVGSPVGRRAPLADRRILIGRPAGRSGSLITALAAEGAVAQAIPLIRIEQTADSGEWDGLVLDAADGSAEWIVFTSVNAVSAIVARSAALGLPGPVSAATKVAAVGPATAHSLQAAGIAVDLQPAHSSGAGLVESFPTSRPGELVLLPRSDLSDATVSDGLRDKGFEVRAAVAYRTVPLEVPPSIADHLTSGAYDAVVVTSSSGVVSLRAAAPAPTTVLVAIGEPTASALRTAGFARILSCSAPTDAGVIAALRSAFSVDHPSPTGGSPSRRSRSEFFTGEGENR